MESKPPKRRRPEWLPALHDPAPPRLWRIGYALAVSFAVAAAGLAALWQAALVLLNHPHLPHARLISLHDTVGVAQLVFASVAGAGALVALVVAYRRERLAETTADLDRNRWEGAAAHDRTRLLNERFTTIAGQLGDDQAAVRLAGVHAMAGLADDWQENRQTCADVLCAYLRMPYERTPDEDAPAAAQLAFQGNREVRHTVIRVITRHLRPEAAVSWQGLDFDFTGVVFDGGDFSGAQFSGGTVDFSGAQFSGGTVDFRGAQFSGGTVDFADAEFSGGTVHFGGAQFSGGTVDFGGMFAAAQFSGGTVNFTYAQFSGGTVNFGDAEFSGGTVHFGGAQFSGGTVNFTYAQFSGGTVDFGGIADWSHPPRFSWEGIPPAGVKLPEGLAADEP